MNSWHGRRPPEEDHVVLAIMKERDHARARWDEYARLAEATALDLNAAEERVEQLREALGLLASLCPPHIMDRYRRIRREGRIGGKEGGK